MTLPGEANCHVVQQKVTAVVFHDAPQGHTAAQQ